MLELRALGFDARNVLGQLTFISITRNKQPRITQTHLVALHFISNES